MSSALPPKSPNSSYASTTSPSLQLPVVPTLPPPNSNPPIRNESTGSLNSHGEDLRRQVERKKDSLTFPELTFLDQLAIHGNEIEVKLAIERLNDTELFFTLKENNNDKSTPRSLSGLDLRDTTTPSLSTVDIDEDGNRDNNNNNSNNKDDDNNNNDTQDGEKKEGEEKDDLNNTSTNSMSNEECSTVENDSKINMDNRTTIDGSNHSKTSKNVLTRDASAGSLPSETAAPIPAPTPAPTPTSPGSMKLPSKPRPKLVRNNSGGSHRRLQVLEQRKQSTIHGKMWKAHENGLALTRSASRRSLLKRSISGAGGSSGSVGLGNSSIGFSGTGSISASGNGFSTMSMSNSGGMMMMMKGSSIGGSTRDRMNQTLPIPSNVVRNTSTSAQVGGNRIGTAATTDMIFRARSTADIWNQLQQRPRSNINSRTSTSSRQQQFQTNPLLRRDFQRAHSLSLPRQHAIGRHSTTGSIPSPIPFGSGGGTLRDVSETTTRSTASRKSVTFAQIDLDEDKQQQQQQQKPRKMMHRSMSDSIQYHVVDEDTLEFQRDPTRKKQQDTTASDLLPERSTETDGTSSSSPPPGTVERSTSISSIPSIRPAVAVRSESMSSIPSLHHARRLRSEESYMGMDESSSSVVSIPSLHHGHPIRDVSSVASTSGVSIPSLHHGHPVRDINSVASITTSNADATDPMDRMLLSEPMLLYGGDELPTTDQVAAAWLEEKTKKATTTDSSLQKTSTRNTTPTEDDDADNKKEVESDDDSDVPLNVNIPKSISTPPPTPTSSSKITTSSESTEKEYPTDESDQKQNETSNVDDDDDGNNVEGTAKTTLTAVIPAVDEEDEEKAAPIDPTTPIHDNTTTAAIAKKPVLMRLASQSAGEGIEVTDARDPTAIDGPECSVEEFTEYFQQKQLEEQQQNDYYQQQQQELHHYYRTMMSLGDISVRTCSSWDGSTTGGIGERFRHQEINPQNAEIFRNIRKSLSDEDMSNLFLGSSANLLLLDTSGVPNNLDLSDELGSSWDMNSDSSGAAERFDSWGVLKDEYVNGYGGGGTLDFRILGTSADDESAQPHVLSPPLMESLQAFLPFSKSGENFYLKYSLVRDGASFLTFLQRARGTNYTILAIETVEGEVFGSFTAQAWRKNWNYFGTGESFLWRMRRTRLEKTHSVLEQAQMESEIDVYPFTGENRYIQLCTHDRLAVGGGSPYEDNPTVEKKVDDFAYGGSTWAASGGIPSTNMAVPTSSPFDNYNDTTATSNNNTLRDTTNANNIPDDMLQGKEHEWGFGLSLSDDLLSGTTSRCMTFGNPSLSKNHSDGSSFEIMNIELWTLTPCMSTEEAEKLELGKLFLEREMM